jgi:hypothetical protein
MDATYGSNEFWTNANRQESAQWLQPAIVLAIQWAMRRFLITSQQSLNSAASSPLFAASVLRNTAKQ